MEWGGWRRYREEKLVKGLLNFWWFVKICNRHIFHMKIIITLEKIWNFDKWDKRNYHDIVLLDFWEFLNLWVFEKRNKRSGVISKLFFYLLRSSKSYWKILGI